MKTVLFSFMFLILFCENPSSVVNAATLNATWALAIEEGSVKHDSISSIFYTPFEKPPTILKFTSDSLYIWSITDTGNSLRKTKYHLANTTIIADDRNEDLGVYQLKADSLIIEKAISDNQSTGYNRKHYYLYTGSLPTVGNANVDPYVTYRQKVIDKINEYRATLQLPPLSYLQSKDSCADTEAMNDALTNTAHGAYGRCSESAQNECPNYPNPDDVCTTCLQIMWNEGPGTPFSEHGHYINMSSTTYTKVSVGFYRTNAGKVWAVMNFYK